MNEIGKGIVSDIQKKKKKGKKPALPDKNNLSERVKTLSDKRGLQTDCDKSLYFRY